ncbi:cation:proton antiporter [Metallosphaera tengchongensis]|uniref:Cation:proton antiporter n=1 Tax=Metallosphaera tengchongensis TaxID=1532350 RepID=A0A6N0NZN9_9CREN|nr:cation:proton antiporter [Metallosphaera tengchongensis]QKR00601.1 cation:proton antiporter [Metallosphaera tengchongensis]
MDVTLVLLEISVMIFVAEALRTSLSKVSVPSLIGEILAGLLLSPYALGGLIDSATGVKIFTLNNYLLFISEFSMILLIFSSGLEHGISPIKNSGVHGILGATLGAILPFLAAFLAFSNSVGTDSALILGSAVGATSMAAAASIIESGKLKGRGIDLLMSMASTDDVVDLVLLSIILGTLAGQSSPLAIAKATVFYIVAWAVIFLVSIKVIPIVANRLGDVYIEEFSMLIIFGLTALMTSLNFSPVISSFIAGVALAESVKKERVHQLVTVLLSVFGSIFFVTVGAQVDVAAINMNQLLLALEITAIAVAFKILGVLPFAYLALRNLKASISTSLGMVPRGETGLVVGSIGLSVGALNSAEFSAVVLMALFSTVIGGLLFRWTSKWLE